MSTKIEMEIPCKNTITKNIQTKIWTKNERDKKKKKYYSSGNRNNSSNKEQRLQNKECYGTLLCVVNNNEKQKQEGHEALNRYGVYRPKSNI